MRALTSAEFYTVFDIWVEAATKNSKKDWWREEFLVAWEYLQANGWRSVVHSDSPQPVDSYCREFHAWANKKADDRVFWRHWCTIELTIHKSCLLDRLIYGGGGKLCEQKNVRSIKADGVVVGLSRASAHTVLV